MANQIKSIDANILIDYFLLDNIDKDQKEGVRKLFHPSNLGDVKIKIFVYTLGEVFKRLLVERDGNHVQLDDKRIEKRIEEVQGFISKGFISIIRMEDVSKNFFAHYQKIDELDGFIGTGDKMALAAFCEDSDSKIFYSRDTKVLKSTKVISYITSNAVKKKIEEL